MGNSGTKFEEIFEAVKRDPEVRKMYAGKRLPSFLKYTGARSFKIIDAAKKREEILKNNNTPAAEIPGKIADFMKQELDRLINEDQYTEFGRTKKTNGVLMFGNTAAITLADMMGDVEHKDQAEFGKSRRRHRRSKKNSFGKKKRGGSGKKKSRKHRRA